LIRLSIILPLLLLATTVSGQSFKAREHVAPAVLVFAAGAFEGVMDHLQFHYDKPNQFWNPSTSWRNKYRNRDVSQGMTFRGKYLVFTTDGWHLMKFGRNATLFTAFTLKIGEKKKWYWYLAEGAGYWFVNRVGFNLTYKWMNL